MLNLEVLVIIDEETSEVMGKIIHDISKKKVFFHLSGKQAFDGDKDKSGLSLIQQFAVYLGQNPEVIWGYAALDNFIRSTYGYKLRSVL